MWCTHPFDSSQEIFAEGFDLTEGSKIVTAGGAATDFTLLCQDIQTNNSPLNRYIAYYNDTTYGIIEVDYVLNASTLVLKYPAFETTTATGVGLIDYWGTPILKEVEVRTLGAGSAPSIAAIANKYSSSDIAIYDVPFTANNEGGVEPQLISTDFIVTLKY